MTCLQSPGKRNISELCLFWNYYRCSFICFTACLQLVKVSTVYVFLGGGLLVHESEFQEDQYLFEICLVKNSVHNCQQIAIPVFPVFQASLQLVSARSLKIVLFLIGSDLQVKIYRVPRWPDQPKLQKLPQAQLKRFKLNLVHMKSLQAQTKNKTQKSLSNHQRHNYSQICSCPTLKVLRWIGQ